MEVLTKDTSTPITPSLVVGLHLSGKKVGVFGNDSSASNRVLFALDAGADVVLYGPDVPNTLGKWVDRGRLRLAPVSAYSASDVGAFNVVFVGSADTGGIDRQVIVEDARAAGVPINVAGHAELSDFGLLPAYRGATGLQIAVTTNGVAPRVASRLLHEIVSKLPADLEPQLGEVAKLAQVVREAEGQRAQAVRKLEDQFVEGASTPDISTAATAIQTPEQPRSEHGSAAGEDKEPLLYQPAIDLESLASNKVSASIEQLTDSREATNYVAHALSDLCFVYSSVEQGLGEAALAWSRQAEKNAYSEWVSVLRMQTRLGAGHALWGALASGAKVSAILGTASLPYMLPVLQELVARKQPIVVHASAQSLDEATEIQTDFADVFTSLQSQAVHLVSSTAQEAHDMAIVAHAISHSVGIPVVHVMNGSKQATKPGAVKLVGHRHLKKFVNAVSKGIKTEAAANRGDISGQIAQLAFVQFKSIFGRTYCDFEYTGSSKPETVFVSMGQIASSAQDQLPSLLNESVDVGVLNVRVLRPWDHTRFLSSLPASTKRVIVLDASSQEGGSSTAAAGVLVADISLSSFVGRPLNPIQIELQNVYGYDETGFANVLRSVVGLEVIAAVVSTDSANEHVAVDPESQDASSPAEATATKLTREDIAKQLVFTEAYSTQLTARPGEQTFTVKVSSKYRMTPDTYDRDIFHIEFDTRGTDLTYEIGDALGVYGHNDPNQVTQFCKLYGLDEEQLVTASRDSQVQTRSVRSWLTNALDLFGRPSKKFYAALADFAADPAQADKLRWLTSSEGSVEFKDRVADTVTYADLLLEFESARPSILHLVDLIAPIKPRHYSIASSAKMHPGSVHLCVVSVAWKTSKGEMRTGQCTRFLNSLSIGDEVVVSVKPSVMKLPPLDSQPVIMAGLGTGMAPFRAFIEERAVRKMEGVDVGPMTLYFGSRHRAMEYLYAEEFEAYHADGLLTNLRLAFSRDQKDKVYIQHLMRGDSDILASQMLDQEGCFYLCGPTWPSGDVKDAMVSAFTSVGGVKSSEANKVIEELKEHERYVLEVY